VWEEFLFQLKTAKELHCTGTKVNYMQILLTIFGKSAKNRLTYPITVLTHYMLLASDNSYYHKSLF